MTGKLRTIGQKLRPPARNAMISVRPKEAKPFYLSPEWKALMRQIIKVRGRRCEDPQHDLTKPRDGVRLYGDHIVEIADGGRELDPFNILLRCGPCNGRKTAAARAARAHGVGGHQISGA
jgi:5-methylcytosine-specific restriction protein A